MTNQATQVTKSFGQRVRVLRETIGLSRPKFATAVGICPTTLKNYELNYRELSIPSALAVSSCFKNEASVTLFILGLNDDFINSITADQLRATFNPKA